MEERSGRAEKKGRIPPLMNEMKRKDGLDVLVSKQLSLMVSCTEKREVEVPSIKGD